jgi:hypothetical protein
MQVPRLDHDVRPERVIQRLSRDGIRPRFDEQLQQAKCFRRQRDGRAVTPQVARLRVERERSETQRHRRRV